ncbi:MAG: hypothetical protein K6B46_06885 [Opitutales bacterium]|nr:hypothetical protein [Opitutales bacterium]
MRFLFYLFALMTLAFAACYSPGAHGQLPFATVTVMPVKSEIDFASTQVLLAKNLAETINAEPELRAVAAGGAAELFVTLTDLDFSTAIASDYDARVDAAQNIVITATVSLRNARDGSWYFQNRTVTASLQSYSLGSSATQAYPAISRVLARRICDQIVSVW